MAASVECECDICFFSTLPREILKVCEAKITCFTSGELFEKVLAEIRTFDKLNLGYRFDDLDSLKMSLKDNPIRLNGYTLNDWLAEHYVEDVEKEITWNRHRRMFGISNTWSHYVN